MEREKDIFENKYFRKVIDALPAAVYTTDAKARLTYFNSAAVEFSGQKPKLGTDQWYLTWKLFHPDGTPMPHEECPMVLALEEDRSIKGAEAIVERPDGKRFWFEAYPSPLHDDEGKVFGGINMLLNITERKKAQQELQALNENLEERVEERTQALKTYQNQLRKLVARLSEAEEQERHRLAGELHDNLGQLLTLSKIEINTLQNGQLSDSMPESLEKLNELIGDALTYTRDLMSDLKPPPTLDKEDLRASIEWVANKMKKHNLEVIVEDDERPKRTREEIRTILVQSTRELLFNVLIHANVDEAYISMSRSDEQVEIIVRDEGEGFDPAALDLTNIEEGGFGLYHIRERINMLGGSVDIISEPGEGTKVILRAPMKENTNEDPSTDHKKTSSSTGKEKEQAIKVLLVDDHNMMREGLRRIVNAQNDLKVVGEASDGEESVELAAKVHPEIIIMDINLPGMNGIEATQKIKSKMPNVRIIGISFHDGQEVIQDMRDAGASAYLKKDEAFEALCETIRSEAQIVKK